MIQTLVSEGMNVSYLAAEPAVLFINGEYWGIHNIRERYNEQYFKRHYGIDSSNLVLLEFNTDVEPFLPEIQNGTDDDLQDYYELIEYVKKHDLSENEPYRYVCDKVDIDNLIDYFITQMYIGNYDWPGNNYRIWRARQNNSAYGDNKWRFVFYDADYSFDKPDYNTVEYILKEDYDKEILDGISMKLDSNRELILELIKNPDFKNKFFSRFTGCMNTIFSSDRVENEIEYYERMYEPEMESHFSRWHIVDGWYTKLKRLLFNTNSYNDTFNNESWTENINSMKNFAIQRPYFIRKYLEQFKQEKE